MNCCPGKIGAGIALLATITVITTISSNNNPAALAQPPVAENAATLLYTINNLGYTDTCG